LLINPATRPVAFVAGQVPTLLELIYAPVMIELRPGSQALTAITQLYNSNTLRTGTTLLPVAGTVPIAGTEILKPLFGAERYDGLIGEAEALLQGSILNNVQRIGAFSHNHVQLECANDIVQAVGNSVLPINAAGFHSCYSEWSGNYDGTFYYTGGGTTTLSGSIELTIQNNQISTSGGCQGSGNINNSGNGSWQISDCTPYNFTGTFTMNGNAHGTWTLTIPGQGTGNGTWTATAQ
jgi:hypothetical protein